MNTQLPSAAQAKDQAKRLRIKMTENVASIGHAKSLELVAHQHGFRDWNTLFAAIGNGPPKGWAIGGKVSGTYLSQPFTGHVVSISIMRPGWFRLELHLDDLTRRHDVDDFHLHKVAAAQLAVDGHIEQHEVSMVLGQFKSNTDCLRCGR